MFSAPFASNVSRSKQVTGAYHQVGLQSMVTDASAHGLVALLFDGFMSAVNRAKGALRSHDIQAKGKAITHAEIGRAHV